MIGLVLVSHCAMVTFSILSKRSERRRGRPSRKVEWSAEAVKGGTVCGGGGGGDGGVG